VSGGHDAVREPAVAGSFYPARPQDISRTVEELLGHDVQPGAGNPPMGVLVPHAGLVYSGRVAAAGWRSLLDGSGSSPCVVILGTNHSAWFGGVAVFGAGVWRTPVADVPVDDAVADRILELGEPFAADLPAHRDEHSIEVQLPILLALRPVARIVPCSVAAGTGADAVEAGRRLGEMLADLRASGQEVLLAISTDMAHYPVHDEAVRVTERLAPWIAALDPVALAHAERAETRSGARGMACGMCGIQPTVLGLAAMRAMGATLGRVVAAATSADAGGDPHRTVGYLAVAFS
jgi:AmmeMemoRadiSam system protein B